MNKIFAAFLVSTSAIAFTACVGQVDDVFDKTATERLDEAKGIYAQRLIADGGKWVMEYYPTQENEAPIGLGYLMTCSFTSDYKVVVAMNNEVTDKHYKESTSAWEVLTDNGPVLSFNTYNDVLHTFSKPENIPSFEQEDKEDETGRGYEGDYEFVITSLDEGAQHAMLKGKKRGTYNRLTRLEAGTDFNEYLADVNAFVSSKFPANGNDLRFVFDGKLYYVHGMGGMLPNIYPSDGDIVVDKDLRSYLVIKEKDQYYLRFRDAFGSGDNAEQTFVYDSANDQFVGTVNSANVLRGISDDELPYYLNSEGGVVMGFGITETVSHSDLFTKMVAETVEAFPAYNKSYTLNSIRLSVVEDGKALNLIFNYQVNRSKKSVSLRAKFVANDKGILIEPWQAQNNDGKNLLNDIAAVKALADMLSGQYDIKVVGSRLNISEMRFDKIDNSSFWFSSVCK